MTDAAWQVDRDLLDALPLMIWVADRDGRMVFMNARERTYTGRDDAWLREHGWLALVHPDDVPLASASWTQARAGDLGEVEFRLRRHDGEHRWHLHRTAPMRDADGRLLRWVGTSIDVHERRVAQDALTDARRDADHRHALLDALLGNAPIGIGFLDTDLRLTSANRALVADGGRTLEEFLGQHVRTLAGPAYDQLAPLLDRVVAERETVADIPVSEPDRRRPDRLRHWSLGYYPVELEGALVGVGVLSSDETHNRELLTELQASEELRTLTERAGALGSWEYEVATRRSRWSAGLRHLLGVTDDVPADPTSFVAVLHPDDREAFERSFADRLAAPGTMLLRHRIVRPDGAVRVLEVRGASEGVDGAVTRLYGTTQDVTEQVERADRIEQVERLLTDGEALARMGSFEVSFTSGHVLLSPGLADLLGRDADVDAVAALSELRALVHPDDRPQRDALFVQAMRTGGFRPVQLRLRLPTGQQRTIEVSASCDFGEDGAPRRLLGTTVDVTEREQLRQERVELLERTITARDHERRRIAEHLHDEAVQAVTASLLRVDHALASGSTQPLERARPALEAAIRSLRLNIMELAPVDLGVEGLEATIAGYAHRLFEDERVAVTLEVALGNEARIPEGVQLVCYQLVREALTNVHKHARATAVRVVLAVGEGVLSGEVTDDGVGLVDEESRPGHLGTRLMRERVALVGGAVVREAARGGRGTTVRWQLPL